MQNKLIVVTGPVGSGKTVIFQSLKKKHPSWKIVKSYTTRKPRPNEKDEKFIFITEEEFKEKVKTDEIIEYEKYAGNFYGTSKSSIHNLIEEEDIVITHVNLKGAEYLKKNFSNVVDIYLYVPVEILKQRIEDDKTRGKKDMKEYEERFKAATKQNKQKNKFTHIIENTSSINSAVTKIKEIIQNNK